MMQDMSTGNLHSPFFIKFNESSITSFSHAKPKAVIKPENEIDNQLNITHNSDLITDILKNERLKLHNE